MARVLHSAVVRTRFYDDFLMDACVRGCHQVVLLAAGLDSRAFRLPWPNGGRLWEMDLPAAAPGPRGPGRRCAEPGERVRHAAVGPVHRNVQGRSGRNTPVWLTERGWQVQLNDRDTVADGFGRPAPSPSAGGFIRAVRTG
jgi:O-methyltransferase involved in polyketide biosynthesis